MALEKRKPDEWMPLIIGKYLSDTTHLTRDQHGGYLLLLMAYWRRGGPLPADDARLAAIVKATPAEWKRLRPVMAEFFREEDGHWHQKRADQELLRANGLTDAKSEAGKEGARRRWQTHGKTDGTNDSKQMAEPLAEPMANASQTDAPLPSPTQESSLRSDSVIPKRRTRSVPKEEPPGFAAFYDAFPLHIARRKAAESYRSALTRASAEVLLAGAKRYADQRRDEDPKYTAYPTTWLNQDRWLDEGTTNGANRTSRNGNGRKPNAHDAHLEGLYEAAQAAERADGRPEGVPEPGQLALSAPRHR